MLITFENFVQFTIVQIRFFFVTFQFWVFDLQKLSI